MYSALFPDLQKMALCCSHGLVTFDLKIRCEIRRLWRLVAVGSVDAFLYERVKFVCNYTVNLFLNFSCSIDVSYFFAYLLCVFFCDLFSVC